MTIISIEQAGKYDGQEVTIRGWLYNLRESGKLMFPIFRDGTGVIQGVCALKENPEAFEALKGLTQESSVIVTGKIRAEQRAPGGFEMGVSRIQVLQKVLKLSPIPSSLRNTASIFFSTTAISGFARRAKPSILRILCRSLVAPRAITWIAQGYILTDAPDVYARGLRRDLHTFRSELHRRPESLPDAKRSALHRSHRHGPRQGLHFSAPRFARKNQRLAATSRNSGC